jgi:hypothetical protein
MPGTPSPDRTPPNMRELQKQLQQQMLVRSGMSLFAVLAGLACYYGALHFGFSQTVAGVAGFVFALLVWIAARSLLRDWFPSTARSTPPESSRQETRQDR